MSTEARRSFAVPLEVLVRLLDGSERREWAVDLSAGGLCLHASERLPDEGILLLSFELADVKLTDIAAHVVWEAPDPGGRRFYETGLSFESLSVEEQGVLREWAAQPTRRRR